MTEDETHELLRLREDTTKTRMRSSIPTTSASAASPVSARSSALRNANGTAGTPDAAKSDGGDGYSKRSSPAHFPGTSVAGIKPLTWMFFSLAAGLIYGYNVRYARLVAGHGVFRS
ncbi:hypothetical protein PINS_up012676 [Pythium insidiosum]|nr:hypothetical protein PINS_up012676 [Pythium insidiosum]